VGNFTLTYLLFSISNFLEHNRIDADEEGEVEKLTQPTEELLAKLCSF
jgi:hypothetical protein